METGKEWVWIMSGSIGNEEWEDRENEWVDGRSDGIDE